MQLRQGVFGRLRIVSNWSIDPLDLERDVTNVIPLRPNSEGLNPTQMIDRPSFAVRRASTREE